MSNDERIKRIEEELKMVYDPEFPIVDIFTLWLIYNIEINSEQKEIKITMTFTTPACPMADMLKDMTKEAVKKAEPNMSIVLEITFDPMRNIKMIKDPDVKRMFE